MPKNSAKIKSKTKTLPKRADVPVADQWDLTQLYASDAAWEADFEKWQKQVERYATFQGRLGESAGVIVELLQFDADLERAGERLGSYAGLHASADQANSNFQRMKGRFQHAAVKAGEAAAYIRPELLAIPQAKMEGFLNAADLAPWKLALERIVRYKPHTLTQHEEQLLAMSGNMADGPGQIFRQLTDTDLKWPVIEDENGVKVELGHSSFSKFLQSPKRSVRKEAFHTYYAEYEKHKHTLAASYNAAVQRDIFYSKARKYPSAREASLFSDNVPVAVYDALIAAVHRHLPTNHRYLALRRKALKLPDVHMYDTYVPMVSGIKTRYTWEQAAGTVCDALAPLGEEYVRTLREGLGTGRWSDRYPNQGKRSGAFSAGGFDGPPYILMNYQEEVLDHMFTLAHEAGHSMHTWHSARHQPFQYYNYTIFVAEVASTFNEQLLLKHMLDRAKSDKEKAYLLNHAIDEIRGTIIRQTMFAEFEKIAHDLVEKGEPLTVDLVRAEYRKLLEKYFGVEPLKVAKGKEPPATSKPGKKSHFVIDQELEMECLRIPHFYGGFYVYKYATGLSAAIALSNRVMNGGTAELNDYLNFLKGGCSKWPLDLLRNAGVDMEQPAPVETALKRFAELVDQLEELL
ncbi:MAG TPA: oligoendopeptidase F [Phycisphaerae bacterium]|nr:oligoendopeptidase F [Phycisphaerae bacterium]